MIEIQQIPVAQAGSDPLVPIGINTASPPGIGETGQTHILKKPVYWVDTPPINKDSGFIHKHLCDGLTFTAGTACAFSCQYCYVLSQVQKQEAVQAILNKAGQPFNRVVIRRNNVLRQLAQQLTATKRTKRQVRTADTILTPELIQSCGLTGDWSLSNRVPKYQGQAWDGKVIFASPFVDIAATPLLAHETIEMCEVILRLTNFNIRLLSKSRLLVNVAKELHQRLPDPLTGAKARVIFGLSTGTLDDNVALAIETNTALPSLRLKALHWLQDNGFRTYGMLCPILPQTDEAAYVEFSQRAMTSIRATQCEEIWAEPVNFRAGRKNNADEELQQNSFQATLTALTTAGLNQQAELFDGVANDSAAWESYCRNLFEALVNAAPEQNIQRLIVGEKAKAQRPTKLWWLHYARTYESIRDYWDGQQVNGALLLGGVVTRYRNHQKKALKTSGAIAAENTQ
ncbi:MAG: hypothetical protein NT154_08995 [Verrucomicrobia bacterium]|nr:hypothetical protein [Verrucomicrobiota bacterium]